MLLRPFLNDAGSCASYLFGCTSHNKLAVVDPHSDFVDDYLAAAAAIGAPIVAVFETHVQADHVSGLPALVDRTGGRAYLPAGTGVEFEHVPLSDWEVVELGNTLVTAIATPGHAPAHHVYAVADRRRGSEEPWLAFSGDSLLIGGVGRPDLHAAGDAHRQRGCSMPACAGCSSCPTMSCSIQATTAARSAGEASLATRSPRSASSALTTGCLRSPIPTPSPRRFWLRAGGELVYDDALRPGAPPSKRRPAMIACAPPRGDADQTRPNQTRFAPPRTARTQHGRSVAGETHSPRACTAACASVREDPLTTRLRVRREPAG
jgi:hypothetical protein